MKSSFRIQPLLAGAIALALTTAGGCGWFKTHNDYVRSVENRPLEVPPGLDAPETSNQLPLPSSQNLGANAPSPVGFVVPDSPEIVWPRVGAALAGMEGVTLNGSAKALGSYDVGYQGQNFLLRIENTAGQSRISAISATGQVLRAGPASILLEKLRSKL